MDCSFHCNWLFCFVCRFLGITFFKSNNVNLLIRIHALVNYFRHVSFEKVNFAICSNILSVFSEVSKGIGTYILSIIVLFDNLTVISCKCDLERRI